MWTTTATRLARHLSREPMCDNIPTEVRLEHDYAVRVTQDGLADGCQPENEMSVTIDILTVRPVDPFRKAESVTLLLN